MQNDLQTNGGTQLKHINEMADELTSEGHTQSDNIRARQRQITQIWNDLQKLMRLKNMDLDTAERLASFHENCGDMRAWMSEKFDLLAKQPAEGDMKMLQALQRRYQNLERDLKPLEERMNVLNKLAMEIVQRHPEHRVEVERLIAELGSMHKNLLKQARLRINEAEQSQGQQMFDDTAK